MQVIRSYMLRKPMSGEERRGPLRHLKGDSRSWSGLCPRHIIRFARYTRGLATENVELNVTYILNAKKK